MSADQALILIVDDDFDFLEINRIILEGAGYRVVTATNPAEAEARIATETPDLVITDLMMTSIDAGFAFAARLKSDPRTAGVPIIISTSVSSALGLNFHPDSAERPRRDERRRVLRQADRRAGARGQGRRAPRRPGLEPAVEAS